MPDEIDLQQLEHYLREECNVDDLKHVAFYIEYIRNGFHGARAYHTVYKNPNLNSCSVLASRLLSKVKMKDLLDIVGLGTMELVNAVKSLSGKHPKEYVDALMKLNRVEVQKHEVKVVDEFGWTEQEIDG